MLVIVIFNSILKRVQMLGCGGELKRDTQKDFHPD